LQDLLIKKKYLLEEKLSEAPLDDQQAKPLNIVDK
jgi:hypothetical protein